MQAATAWKLLFSKPHLMSRYYEKVSRQPSVGLDKVTNEKFKKTSKNKLMSFFAKYIMVHMRSHDIECCSLRKVPQRHLDKFVCLR